MKWSFPDWLFRNNTKLEYFNLKGNSFLGHFNLPLFLSSIYVIDVSNNQLIGKLQRNIGEILPFIHYLNLSNNFFTGSLPSSIGNMNLLWTFDVSINNFSREVPKEFLVGCSMLSFLYYPIIILMDIRRFFFLFLFLHSCFFFFFFFFFLSFFFFFLSSHRFFSFLSSHLFFSFFFFLMGCYSLFWAFLALIFRLDYFSFFWVFSGFVMFVLLTGFMTWDQTFKYPNQTLKSEIFWLHFLGLFYEIKALFFFFLFFLFFFFSLYILLLPLGCSRWVLFKETKMWSGEDAFCWALIFVGLTILLKIEFLNWNTHWEFPGKHTTNRVMGKLR